VEIRVIRGTIFLNLSEVAEGHTSFSYPLIFFSSYLLSLNGALRADLNNPTPSAKIVETQDLASLHHSTIPPNNPGNP
jgi:hypothetical protein